MYIFIYRYRRRDWLEAPVEYSTGSFRRDYGPVGNRPRPGAKEERTKVEEEGKRSSRRRLLGNFNIGSGREDRVKHVVYIGKGEEDATEVLLEGSYDVVVKSPVCY